MSQQQTPVKDTPVAADTPAVVPATQTQIPAPPPTPKKRRRKIPIGRLISTLLILALLGGGGFATWYFVFRQPPEVLGDVLLGTVSIGSITSTVEGSGLATAKDSATLTINSMGIVSQVFVADGDQVNKGDPLYVIKSETAEQEIADAQEAYNARLDELNDLNKERSGLVIQAPHPGKLMDVKTLKPGDEVSKGDTVATLVNDTKLRLHLYYNYIYEHEIQVGQSASISIPAVMGSFPGKVETINMVSRIFPEGGKGFEVVFVLDNPDTLTAGMDASAALTAADGSPIYPYENSKLEYFETTELKAKANGPVVQANLLNYAAVSSGATLVTLGDDEISKQIQEKQEQVDQAQKKLAEAQKAMADFSAVAPISGTVFSCNLIPGQEVKSGDSAVTISDTSSMSVEITVDDRNIRYISAGQTIDFTDYDGNVYMGTVDNVNLNGKSENGMTTYPVKVTVDNADGTLVNGVYLNYSFTASQSLDCLTVPIQAVNSVSDAEGNLVSVVYLQADSRPDNTVEVSEEVASKIPAGFYPVPVEVGLPDVSSVEIKSGVNDGDTVFLGYQKDTGAEGAG